jgi:hypothetical protein
MQNRSICSPSLLHLHWSCKSIPLTDCGFLFIFNGFFISHLKFLEGVSWAPMICLNMERQYSGDSFQTAGFFIQTPSQVTFLWILRPVSVTLADQFTQTFPQVSVSLQCFLSWWGGRSCAPGDPHSPFQCRSSFVVCQRHPVDVGRKGHAHKQWLPLHLSLRTDSW